MIKASEYFNRLKTLSDEDKGDKFETFCKSYLEKLYPTNIVYLYDSIPIGIIKKLKLPLTDKGLDILMINKELDKTYGVQCKFRSDKNICVPYGELSTFAGMLNHCDFGIYMTNTLFMCQELESIEKISAILGYDFEGFYFNPDVNVVREEIIVKRKYQEEMIEKGVKYFSDKDEGEMIVACGCGKTIMSHWLMKELKSKKVLYVVPSLLLVNQTYKELVVRDYYDKYFLFCSESEIKNDIVNITTSVENIKFTDNKKTLVISTYNSLYKLIGLEFDFTVFDEFHKIISGDEYYKRVEEVISKKKLYMTATKKIVVDDKIITRNSKEVFFKYDFGQAIEDGFLSDYDIILDIYNDSIIKNTNDEYMKDQVILDKLFSDGVIKKCLTYFSFVDTAKTFSKNCKKMPTLCNVSNNSFSGEDSLKYRNKCIEEFSKEPKACLHTARVLQEGINIPCIDSVMFCDSKNSVIDIIQCIGRSLRLHEGKTKAHIILPIKYDESIDSENISSKYSFLMTLLASLKKHDYRVITEIKKAKQEKRMPSFIKYHTNIISDTEFDKFMDFYDNINYIIIDKLRKSCVSWDNRYLELETYLKRHENKYPSSTSKDKLERSLGQWVVNQRCHKKKLDEHKKYKLEKLMGWEWKKSEQKEKKTWDESFGEIEEYLKNNENNYPLSNSKNKITRSLGQWVLKQRMKREILDNYRKEKLESLPNWRWHLFKRTRKKTWDESYGELEIYLKNNNNKYPSKYNKNKEIKSLGAWILTQRQNIEKINNIRKIKLELLPGWKWKSDNKKNN